MLMDMCLPEYEIYKGTVAPNCFKSHKNSWCPDFFQKNVLPDIRSEIHLIRHNIVSPRQSVECLKKNYVQACERVKSMFISTGTIGKYTVVI